MLTVYAKMGRSCVGLGLLADRFSSKLMWMKTPMSPPTAFMIDRCKMLGVDQVGLRSIRQFVEVALFHARMPDITSADRHVALNSNLRFATNRIACQGHHGHAVANCRVLSPGAIVLRERIVTDAQSDKFPRWAKLVTEEHHWPVADMGEKIIADLSIIQTDTVVEWLLKYPSVVVTKLENAAIPKGMRHRGSPEARYAAMGRPVIVETGTAAFFDQHGNRTRRLVKGVHWRKRVEFI